jgi:hypothetical protein
MTIFDETQHPRAAVGTFATKTQTPPALSLTPYAPLHTDDSVSGTIWPSELGGDHAAVGWVDWAVVGEPAGVYAIAVRKVDLLELAPGGVTREAWNAELNAKLGSAAEFFSKRYGAELDEDGELDDVELRLDLPMLPIDVDGPAVGNAVRTNTSASALDADAKSDNLGTQLSAYLDDSTEVQLDHADIERINVIEPARIHDQVRSRLGETELDDDIAIAGAAYLAHRYGRTELPALHRLSLFGYINRTALGDDIVSEYDAMGSPDRDLVSMIGTWASNHPGARRA